MVCLDGFVLTHTLEPVDIPDKEIVEDFLPRFKPALTLDPETPITLGAFADPGSYTEFRYEQQKAMERALRVIEKVGEEFGEATGRSYGLVEGYNLEGAEVVIVTMGSLAGTVKEFIDSKAGDVGLLRIRAYRPFPKEEVTKALKDVQAIAVVEKDVSIGFGEGALFSEIKAALYDLKERPRVAGFIAGLGGRDVTFKDIAGIIDKAKEALAETTWVGLK
jgi:pyruvate ferredoxin oxidoreductase alpha subunit